MVSLMEAGDVVQNGFNTGFVHMFGNFVFMMESQNAAYSADLNGSSTILWKLLNLHL